MLPVAMDQVLDLSADLVPSFGESTINMVLVKVEDVHLENQMKDGLEIEFGSAIFQIIEVLHSSTLLKGDNIEVPVKRFSDIAIRDRNNYNQWNNLELMKGELLILAGRIITPPNILMGQAAVHVESPDRGDVIAARQCYVIEHITDTPEKKSILLAHALTQREDLLRFYALDVIGRRSQLGRADGATMISKAIDSDALSSETKVELGYYLTRNYFFDSSVKDDAANEIVVASLAKGMVNETNNERSMEWMNFLGSCVLGEFSANKATDEAMRYALIRSIVTPSPAQVRDVLSKLARLADTFERERIMELLKAWQASSRDEVTR